MLAWRLRVLLAVAALGSAIGLSATLAGQSGGGSPKSDTEWRFFGGDGRGDAVFAGKSDHRRERP